MPIWPTPFLQPDWRRLPATGGAAPTAAGCSSVPARWRQPTTNKVMGFVLPEGRERMAGYGCMEDLLRVLEAAVSRGDYLLGDMLSAADVYLGSQIGWGMFFGTLEKRPAFERYWVRISNRPAAVRARDIDDTLAAQGRREAPAS